jgi:iron complex outermembrane receptor protein
MNSRKPWNASALLSLFAVVSVASSTFAQQVTPPAPVDPKKEEAVKLERFEVTGSMIKRIEGEGALPVTAITPMEMEQRGIATIEQMMMELNINSNGLDNLASNADIVAGQQRGNNGATSANLRMQGAGATLVLLNGRRVASHGLNGGVVDLNQIPFAAIERVEVLKDGASAIYGTDAVGGVMNFILKSNYQGLSASAAADVTEQGGSNIFRYSLLGGWGDLNRDKFNVMASLSLSDSKALRGDQRDFVNTFQPDRGLSPDTRGTPIATVFAITTLYSALSRDNIDNAGRSTGPADPQNPSLRVNGINYVDLPNGPGYAGLDGMGPYNEVLWASAASKYGSAWDTGRAAVLQQPVKNSNLVLRGTFKVAERHRILAEGIVGRSRSNKSFSPSQWTSGTGTTTTALDGRTTVPNPLFNMAYPATGASYNLVFNALASYFPGIAANRGQPLAFRWRSLPVGNRAFTTTSDTYRGMVGAEGPLGFLSQWDYRVGVSRAESKSKSVLNRGYVYSVPFVNLINRGVIDIFSYSQTPEAMAAIDQTRADGVTMYGGRYRTDEIDAGAAGPVFKLPAGAVQAAVGVDWRQENFFFEGDTRQNLNSADALILNAPFDNGLATNGTLKRTIRAAFAELQIPILRGLDFNAAGRIDRYTGFGSTKNPKFTVRYAPIEQFLIRSSYSTGFRVPTFKQMFDPVFDSPLAATGLIDPETGVQIPANSADVLFGGKSDLQPEKARMYSAGVVFQPTKHLSANIDWWEVNRTGTILSFNTTQMLANYEVFKDRFLRRSDGTIELIDTRWVNAGKTATKGVEFGVRGDIDFRGGKLSTGFDASRLLDKRSKLLPTSAWSASELGVFTRSTEIGLKWKHTAFLAYRRGNWTAQVSNLYRSSYLDAVLPGVANGSVRPPNWQPRVKPYSTYGLTVTYRGLRNTTIIAGVKNLFDEDPPFSATYDTNTGAGSSWEPRIADPRGRSYTLRVDYRYR